MTPRTRARSREDSLEAGLVEHRSEETPPREGAAHRRDGATIERKPLFEQGIVRPDHGEVVIDGAQPDDTAGLEHPM